MNSAKILNISFEFEDFGVVLGGGYRGVLCSTGYTELDYITFVNSKMLSVKETELKKNLILIKRP